MNTPNPLIPQGSLQEQSKRKSQIRIIVFSILAIHLVLLGALLIQGCKREESPPPKIEPPVLPVDTNTVVPPPPPPMPAPTNPAPLPAPPPTSAAPPVVNTIIDTAPGAATEHVIAKGDTFGSLAKKYGVSSKAINQANPGVDSTKLKIGQKITIPPKPPGGAAVAPGASSSRSAEPEVGVGETLYTVKKNDTLTKISKETGVSTKALRAVNGLKTDQLRPGQKLKIPAKTAAGAAAVTPPSAPAAPTSAPTAPPAQ